MRRISIYQESESIVVFDDSDKPIDEYCSQLSELMKMGNIAILKTTEASVVLRPSKITGIKVTEINLGANLEEIDDSQPSEDTPPEEPQKTEEIQDIITDVDD